MVRAGSRQKAHVSYTYNNQYEEEDSEEPVSEQEEEEERRLPPKKVFAKKGGAGGGGGKRKKPSVARRPVYKEDSEEDYANGDQSDEAEAEDAGSDWETAPKKARNRAPAKKKTKKKAAAAVVKKIAIKKKTAPARGSRTTGRPAKSVKYSYSDEDEDEDESDEDESEDEAPRYKGKAKARSQKQNRPLHPPISEMIPISITKLADNPRKGSSLAAIKGYMTDVWGADVKSLANKIKKYLINAVADGEVIQTRGKGASGRFTLPGLKIKKRKRSNKRLTKKWDEDEPEYQPKKTARDEEKERHLEELERIRADRKEEEQKKLEEKANRPKPPKKPRKEEWEVELIKKMKVIGDKTWYLVKFEGPGKPQWEPEENLVGCQDMIDNFLTEEKVRLAQEEDRRKREEEDGEYEVQKILEVRFKKDGGKREFLIRWKGHGEDMDSWEPEANLSCTDLIERFMDRWRKRIEVSEKSLRIAPKKVARLNFASSKRNSKRNQGFRVTYEDMDDSD